MRIVSILLNDTRMALIDNESMMLDVSAAVNREHNINYLVQNVVQGRLSFIDNPETGVSQVYLPSLRLSFDERVLNEFPMRFREIVESLIMQVMERRSYEHRQRKNVEPVPKDHGRQYFMTRKMLDKIEHPPNCTVCMDPLVPEGKKRKKVWQLGCDCIFHKQCVNRLPVNPNTKNPPPFFFCVFSFY